MFKWLGRLFSGDTNERVIEDLYKIVDQVNELEPDFESLTNEQLRAKTDEFRRRLREGETLDDLLPEAFAAVREAARRTIEKRHYDVQMVGGIVLHQGKIAEMKTGEGKTLVATLPLYLNALEGKGAHLVTVNDYLVRRDAGWNGPIYHLLGVSLAAIAHDFSAIYDPDYLDPKSNLEDERLVHWRPVTRREAYEADITYGTNNEFGFDYLRDNIATTLEKTVQRPLHYAIVDEVDNILIDEARTPLIISGPARAASDDYKYFAGLVKGLRGIEEREYTQLKRDLDLGDNKRRAEVARMLDQTDYVLDLKHRSIALTDAGILKIERRLKDAGRIPEDASIYEPEFFELTHYLDNAVKAEYVFKLDKDYIVQNGEVVIVDEQTGRTMPGRRWSDGLHEMVEAKEGVRVQDETMVYATITIQNYFRMYTKLAGMTGTALTEAEEFAKIYKLDVVPIPTNRDVIRDDRNDQIFRTEEAKYRAVVREILREAVRQRPVLVGTASIENSERLAGYLKPGALKNLVLSSVLMTTIRDAKGVAEEVRKAFAETLDQPISQVGQGTLRQTALALNLPADAMASDILDRFAAMLELSDAERPQLEQYVRNGLPHQVLNAKLHEHEAGIVAQAGRPGTVTIATNMAGRGTDILLGGNPDSLAANYLEEAGVRRDQIKAVARFVVEGNEAQARQTLEKQKLEAVVLDELVRARHDYDEMLQQFEANPALFFLNRYVGGGADTFAARWEFINDVLQGEIGLARQLVQSTPGLREEQIAQIQAVRADLEAYRNDKPEFLANQLFDRIYAARARLINAVLHGTDEDARTIIAATPTLHEDLIDGIKQIKAQVDADAGLVRQRGGLHIVGTERHEARRIDNQLRGRAGRQGDPGESRFFISLEDELMKRFGPSINRVKGFMARAGFEDDVPIEFGVISKQIEGAQTKVEGFNFDMRKRVVDYDDVMNKQREVIYARRRAILEQGEEQRRLQMLVQRYLGNYADWVSGQAEELAAGAGKGMGVRQELARLLPGSDALDLEQFRAADDARRAELLQPLILGAEAAKYPLRLLLDDVAEFVDFDPDAAFEQLKDADRPTIERYLDEQWREGTENGLEERIKQLFATELDLMVDRYIDDYDGWMTGEIEKAVEASSTQATNTINIEGALRRIQPLLNLDQERIEAFKARVRDGAPELVQRELEAEIRPSYERGNHLRLFADELQRVLPFMPNLPPDGFLLHFVDELSSLLIRMPEQERIEAIEQSIAPVRTALLPVLGGRNLTEDEAREFGQAVTEAWIDALDRLAQMSDDDRAAGLETLVNRAFEMWRRAIGVDLLNRYSRELMLSAIDREWADYLTAMEDLRQGIGLQGLAQRDPLVAYKTQAFKMFEELLDTIDRTTVKTYFLNLPRFVQNALQQQQMGARPRELKVGPNEPCPCGSGKKFKKCHGAPNRVQAMASGPSVAVAAAPGGNGSASAPARPQSRPLTQQQQQRQSGQQGQRRKSKGRDVPKR